MSRREQGWWVVVVLILITVCSMSFKAHAQEQNFSGKYSELITSYRYPKSFKNTSGYYITLGYFNRVDTEKVKVYFEGGDSAIRYKRTWVIDGHFCDGWRKPWFSKGKWRFYHKTHLFWLPVEQKVTGYRYCQNY